MTMIRRSLALAAILLLSFSSSAFAHPGLGHVHGYLDGLSHPLSGLDHILAMIAVGLLAARIGGRALWLVPSAFIAMMALGGAIGMAGLALPYVEIAIAASVLVLGLATIFSASLPLTAAAALAGFFAIFHGQAHGIEMPAAASALTYGLGFITATLLLHTVGIGLGLAFDRLGRRSPVEPVRVNAS